MNDTITNATVKVSWQPGQKEPVVDPSTGTISQQGQVTWQVSLPSGYTVKLDFTQGGASKGPFPLSGQPDNPSQGVFDGPSGNIVSAPTNAAAGTDWKYSVAVYQGGAQVSYVDPIIRIIRN